jgi:putative ABC transport system permease protein
MNPLEVLRISWEAIIRNKIRSILTMLGIIIGIAAVIFMVGISAGTEATIQENITGLGSNLIFVTSSFSRSGISLPVPLRKERKQGIKIILGSQAGKSVPG